MGEPISLSIASQIDMELLEENVIQRIYFPILFFKMHTSDCITAIHKDKIHDL